MIKITFKQLNQGFPALQKLSRTAFPKEEFKLSYKISRIFKACRVQQEHLNDQLNEMMGAHGFFPGTPSHMIDPEKSYQYNRNASAFLSETQTDEIWGDVISYEQIRKFADLTPEDLANLDWLIDLGPETQN